MVTKAYEGIGTRSTPQSEPILGSSQVPNSAGGYAWPVDRWNRLDRFLILGSEGGTYYIGERDLTLENARVVLDCLAEDGFRTIQAIIDVSTSGRAAKNTPAIFALAMAASDSSGGTARVGTPVAKAALDAMPLVCRTGTHVFQFVTLVKQFRGWGRSLRRGVGQWYAQDPGALAYQAIKYRQRDGWMHRDLLRKAHPARVVSSGNPTIETVTSEHERLYEWIVRRTKMAIDHDDDAPMVPTSDSERIEESFERAMAATTPNETAALVREYGSALPREALNPDHLNADVWRALVEAGMPMTALVRNLATLTRKGVIAPMADTTALVCNQITDGERLRKARVHPYAILLAMATYQSGGHRGLSQGEPYQPVTAILEALDAAFYEAFGNVTPTGKRILLALDVSGSMGTGIFGSFRKGRMEPVALSAREGAAAMAMVTKRVEPNSMTVAFASGGWMAPQGFQGRYGPGGGGYGYNSYGLREFDLSARRSLRDVIRETAHLDFGGTDAALPMLYAIDKRIPVDTFVVYTDNETWAGKPHPAQALRAYREASGIAAKLVVVAMSSNGFSIADPNDAGMLDVVGFDTASPNVIADFIAS